MSMMWMLGLVLSAAPTDAEIAADRARIQRHLAQVEADLRAAKPDGLTAAQRAERARNLDRLHAYRIAGVFPHNDDFEGARVPFFIDDDGRACAVGHLMLVSGGEDVAAAIRRDENNAKLLDMQTAGIAEWVARSGLTAQEHARIQPSYCKCPQDDMPVCGTDGQTYLNECYATTCGGVEVAYEGECTGEPTTGWPMPGTSDTTAASEDTGTDDGATTTGGGDDHAEHGDEAADDGGDDDDGGKGCSVADPDPAQGFLALVVLAALRRTRRR